MIKIGVYHCVYILFKFLTHFSSICQNLPPKTEVGVKDDNFNKSQLILHIRSMSCGLLTGSQPKPRAMTFFKTVVILHVIPAFLEVTMQ